MKINTIVVNIRKLNGIDVLEILQSLTKIKGQI
jgi:hypothetical protein